MGCSGSKINIVYLDQIDADDCYSLQSTITSNASFKFNDFLDAVKNDIMPAEVCETYLENEPDAIFAFDKNGDTAIHYAAVNRNMEVLRILVKFKVKCEKAGDAKRGSFVATERIQDDY